MQKLKVLELFGGIGACSTALKRLNINYEIVDYVEIDKYAVKSFNAIHNTNFEPQDISKWDKDVEVDLIMHGSPCQDFSLAGKQAGGDEGSGTRSSLMYETIRIVEKLKPKECFRLMGFNDYEFERASKVNSNAQLYKQAGNSIVVNVLQNIFKNLLMKEGKIMEKKEEVKIISYETNLMIDLEKLAKEEPDLFNDLVKDYPVNPNTKIIIEVKA